MSAILTGTKHAAPKPRIVDPSEVKVESGIPFPKSRCRPGTKWGEHLDKMKKGDCIKFADMRNANIFANAARARTKKLEDGRVYRIAKVVDNDGAVFFGVWRAA